MSIPKLFDELWAFAKPVMSAPALTVIGSVFAFTFYNRRKTNLEIQKLHLEISQLREQRSLIQKPTLEQIEKIRRETEQFASSRLAFVGSDSPIGVFVVLLNHTLTVLLAFSGDVQVQTEILKAKFFASLHNWPDPYPEYNTENESLKIDTIDFARIYQMWKSIRPTAYRELPQDTCHRLDAVLRLLTGGGFEQIEQTT